MVGQVCAGGGCHLHRWAETLGPSEWPRSVSQMLPLAACLALCNACCLLTGKRRKTQFLRSSRSLSRTRLPSCTSEVRSSLSPPRNKHQAVLAGL